VSLCIELNITKKIREVKAPEVNVFREGEG
jgi:hypothetical protein